MTERFAPRRRRGAVALLLSLVLLFAAAATPALGQESDEATEPTAPPELLLVDATADPFLILRNTGRTW